MTNFMYYIHYLIMRGGCFLINLIPFPIAMSMGRFMGRVIYCVFSSRRRITLDNLRAAFSKEKSEDEIKKIAVEVFENLGMLGVEIIRIPEIVKNLPKYVVFENPELGRKELKKGKGVIFLVSHFGNWEWLAIGTAASGLPMSAIARPLRNPYIYEYVKKLRGSTGLESVSKYGGARSAMRMLSQNKVVAILIDQHERQGGVQVPFFGRDASTGTLPAMLAVKKDVPVMSLFFYREKKGPARMFLKEPFPLIKTGDETKDVYENTKQYVKAIEEEVRKRPGTWLWMHRRWK